MRWGGMGMGIEALIEKLLIREELTAPEAESAMDAILDGSAPPAQVAGFLVALRAKGETPGELAAMASSMRRHAAPFPPHSEALDTCGTGGDRSGTFNISTAAAIVAAAMGIQVAKHGNRSVSSRSGSADVLEMLGVRVDAPPDVLKRSLKECNFAFFFAPAWHPAMKRVAPIRAELKVRTVFNMLGPLANPAGAGFHVMGVPSPAIAGRVAETLRRMRVRRAMVVHGEDGTDEISPCGPTRIWDVNDGGIRESVVRPEDAGLRPCERSEISASGPEDSAARIRAALAGREGGALSAVLLNSAAAAIVTGKASSWREGVRLAAEKIESGEAARLLERIAAISRGSS
ncbi:MAG: anthranilate phosphoribosyltransferase [Planctomycetota bacterium]|nr:anthranilate phosphoribosyltransferase [Planctomycetota bacterium]